MNIKEHDYELVCVFNVKENGYIEGLKSVKELLGTFTTCKVVSETDMQDRQLAYLIKKEDRGHFHLFTLKSATDIFVKMDEQLKLQDRLLRHLLIRVEAPRKLKPKKERKPRVERVITPSTTAPAPVAVEKVEEEVK